MTTVSLHRDRTLTKATIVMKMICCWHKDRQVGPEINPSSCDCLIFDKGDNRILKEKNLLSTNVAEKLSVHMLKG